MAARLPINKLPFEDDAALEVFTLPDGTESQPMTKRQYFDIAMADLYTKAQAFAEAKVAESEARKIVYSMVYPKSWDEEGTDKFELGNGWIVEFKRTINVTIDDAQLPSLKEEIEKLPVDPDSGEMPSIDAAVKYKPDLSMSGYKLLRDDVKELLNQALEFKPGTPGVKVNPPKAKATAKASDQKAREAV